MPTDFHIRLVMECLLGIKYGLPVNKCRLITYVDGKKINMSADAWVGVKQLASISHDTKEWIKFYET